MIGLTRKTKTTKWILISALVFLALCFVFVSVDGSLHYHKRFAKHLFRFVKKEKYMIKKGLAIAAMAGMGAKKIVPFPLPLPIPIIHQPIIHEPFFLPPVGKFAAKGLHKGMALDLIKGSAAMGGLGGGLGGVGGGGGLGGMGGLGGLGGLGAMGGLI